MFDLKVLLTINYSCMDKFIITDERKINLHYSIFKCKKINNTFLNTFFRDKVNKILEQLLYNMFVLLVG